MKYFLAVCFFACFGESAAQELIPVGSASGHIWLGKVVRNSALVAKVKVVSATAVPYEDRSDGKPCGMVYQAKVMQVLKGRTDVNVQFFMPLETPPLKPLLDYLVFLAYRSEQDAKDLNTSLRAALLDAESNRLKCKFQQGYYVPLEVAPLPFDAEAGRQFGGEWLSLTSIDGVPSGIVLCEVREIDVHGRDSSSHRRKKSGAAVVSWIELTRLIKKADGVLGFLNRGLDTCER